MKIRRKMQDWKQCDPSIANLKYDGVNTFCKNGCFVCALADITNRTPNDVAWTLKSNGLFTDGYINDLAKAASVLGLEWHGKSTTKPNYACIAWTNYFDNAKTNAIEKHFFVVKTDGSLVDPLGKGIYYPIKEYYLFKAKGENMLPQSEVNDRTFTHNGMGLVWVKGEWIGSDAGDTSKPFPNTLFQAVKPLPVDCSKETDPINSKVLDLEAKNNQLKDQITECNKEVEQMHGLLEDSQEQIDDLKKQIDNMTPEDEIVDSEPSGGLWVVFISWLSKIFKRKE
jgi:hypothetical protein